MIRGTPRESSRPFFLPIFAMLSFAVRVPSRRKQDSSRKSLAVVRMRSGLPHAQPAQRFGIWARQPNSHHHGLGPALLGLLVFSRRRVLPTYQTWPAG